MCACVRVRVCVYRFFLNLLVGFVQLVGVCVCVNDR